MIRHALVFLAAFSVCFATLGCGGEENTVITPGEPFEAPPEHQAETDRLEELANDRP